MKILYNEYDGYYIFIKGKVRNYGHFKFLFLNFFIILFHSCFFSFFIKFETQGKNILFILTFSFLFSFLISMFFIFVNLKYPSFVFSKNGKYLFDTDGRTYLLDVSKKELRYLLLKIFDKYEISYNNNRIGDNL